MDLRRRVPIVRLLDEYDRSQLTGDLLAGITLWAVLVPQGLAYGALAGVPPVTGLYTALGAMALYAVFGTSRELNMGPEGAVAILVATTIGGMAGGDSARFVALAAALAILTGLILLVGGFLKLGWIVRFLSRPILLGYILGSAILIAASQVGDFLGIEAPDLPSFFANVGDTHWPTLTVGTLAVIVILAVRRLGPRWPAYLAGMAAAGAAVAFGNLADRGVAVIGSIPSGVPSVGLPGVGGGELLSLAGPALAIALLVYTDSMLTEQSLAKINEYELDDNQEFFALGASNIGSGLVGGFPANGSQSRSFVNIAAGARSQVSNLVVIVLVVLTLLFLTSLFERLPQAALAGVLLVAAATLVDIPELRRIWTLNRADFWLALLAAALVVGVGVLRGVVAAVLLSLLWAAIRPYRAHTAVLARVPGTDRYRDLDKVDNPNQIPGLIVYRFDAPLYFANAEQFDQEIRRLVEEADDQVEELMLSAEAVVTIDSTAHQILGDLIEDLHGRNVRFTVARSNPEFEETLERSGLADEVDAFHLEVDTGVEAFLSRRDRK